MIFLGSLACQAVDSQWREDYPFDARCVLVVVCVEGHKRRRTADPNWFHFSGLPTQKNCDSDDDNRDWSGPLKWESHRASGSGWLARVCVSLRGTMIPLPPLLFH